MRFTWIILFATTYFLSSCLGSEDNSGSSSMEKKSVGLDSNLYSAHFRDCASKWNDRMRIEDSLVFIDTFIIIRFPDLGSWNHERIYKFKDSIETWQLAITPLNYTSLKYTLHFISQKGDTVRLDGKAELHCQFHIGPEMPEDEVTGEAYPAYQFFDEGKNRWTRLTLTKMRATIAVSGNPALEATLGGHSPTLRN